MTETIEQNTNDELLEFYQYSIYKKLINLSDTERHSFMLNQFGKRGHDLYCQLLTIYPSLGERNKIKS